MTIMRQTTGTLGSSVFCEVQPEITHRRQLSDLTLSMCLSPFIHLSLRSLLELESSACGIYGRQNVTRTDFLCELQLSASNYYVTNVPYPSFKNWYSYALS
jgi:hypothetical protein